MDDFQVFFGISDLLFDLGLIGQLLRLSKSVTNPPNKVTSAKRNVTSYSNNSYNDNSDLEFAKFWNVCIQFNLSLLVITHLVKPNVLDGS